mmetsp:Transcript_12647/g.11200  ORF Transcript_12647/g.11200 Transcript_12647/m.11200 type:complete len:111 (-) Transcript_12647:9-341(-)
MSEFTFSLDWSSPPVIEYYISNIIDPKDYKPGSDSKIPLEERTSEAFFKKVESIFYKEFETNHLKVNSANNRIKYLREGEETTLYNKAKLGEKSYALQEYALERRKNKRK